MDRRNIILVFAILATILGAGPSSSEIRSGATADDLFAQIRSIRAQTLGTDFKCMGDCTRAGYQYGLCQARCSYPDPVAPAPYSPPAQIRPHGTDYQCVNNCTQHGYQYAYCNAKCSY